jgi:hypothetical protein
MEEDVFDRTQAHSQFLSRGQGQGTGDEGRALRILLHLDDCLCRLEQRTHILERHGTVQADSFEEIGQHSIMSQSI